MTIGRTRRIIVDIGWELHVSVVGDMFQADEANVEVDFLALQGVLRDKETPRRVERDGHVWSPQRAICHAKEPHSDFLRADNDAVPVLAGSLEGADIGHGKAEEGAFKEFVDGEDGVCCAEVDLGYLLLSE